MTAQPDPLIHPITRLSICGLLAAGADWVEFAALRWRAVSLAARQVRRRELCGVANDRLGACPEGAGDWLILRSILSKMCLSPSLQPLSG